MDVQHVNPEFGLIGATAAHSLPRAASNRRIVAGLLAVVVGSLLFVSVQPSLYTAFANGPVSTISTVRSESPRRRYRADR